ARLLPAWRGFVGRRRPRRRSADAATPAGRRGTAASFPPPSLPPTPTGTVPPPRIRAAPGRRRPAFRSASPAPRRGWPMRKVPSIPSISSHHPRAIVKVPFELLGHLVHAFEEHREPDLGVAPRVQPVTLVRLR